MLPWILAQEDWDYINEYYPEQRDEAVESYLVFNYNSFKVPTIAVFVIYGLFVFLIIGAGIFNHSRHYLPTLHQKLRRSTAPIRTYLLEAPLFGRRHAEPVRLFGLSWLTFQQPLRLQSLLLFGLVLANVLPVFAFHKILPGDRNLFYPDPHSTRDQFARSVADRTAVLSVGQVPLLFLMAGRRNPAAFVAGLKMNELMLYHRWIARMVWAQALVHAIDWTVISVRSHDLAEMFKDAYWNWGVAALVMFGGLLFLSLRSLREKWYEAFVFLHILMALFATIGTYFHIQLLHSTAWRIYVIMVEISAVIWAFDRTLRFGSRLINSFRLGSERRSQLKVAQANVSFLASNKVARLRISLPSWRVQHQAEPETTEIAPKIAAGHSIMLSLPRLQLVGDHPFSVYRTGLYIDEETNEKRSYIEVLISLQAGMTRKLLQLASETGDDLEKHAAIRSLSAVVDGPYDSQPLLEGVDHILLVAGGIGVTFCMPYLVRAVYSRRYKSCKLVWMVRDADMVEVIEDQLRELDAALSLSPGLRLSIDIFVTSPPRVVASSPAAPIPTLTCSSSSSEAASITDKASLDDKSPQGKDKRNIWQHIDVTTASGRPATVKQLDPQLSPSRSEVVGVVCCGPRALCDWARYETLAWRKEAEWADVELHSECAMW